MHLTKEIPFKDWTIEAWKITGIIPDVPGNTTTVVLTPWKDATSMAKGSNFAITEMVKNVKIPGIFHSETELYEGVKEVQIMENTIVTPATYNTTTGQLINQAVYGIIDINIFHNAILES